jgi:hypothetical protein
MRLLRSAEGVTTGALVPVDVLGELARRWYGDRMSPDWRPRSREESQRILSDVGLAGDFWQLS